MNKIFKVVFNKSLSTYVAVSELAKGKSKSSKTKTSALVATGLLSLAGVAVGSGAESSVVPIMSSGVGDLAVIPIGPVGALVEPDFEGVPENEENILPNSNKFLTKDELPGRRILEEVPYENDEIKKFGSFSKYFKNKISKDREFDLDAEPGLSTKLIRYYKNNPEARKIANGGDGHSISIHLDKNHNSGKKPYLYVLPDQEVIINMPLSSLVMSGLYQSLADIKLVNFGKVTIESNDYIAFDDNNDSRRTLLEVAGSKARLKGNFKSDGRNSRIAVLDYGRIEGSAILKSLENEVKIAGASEFDGKLELHNKNDLIISENGSLYGDVIVKKGGSLALTMTNSYHGGRISHEGEDTQNTKNSLQFRYGSIQLGGITLSNSMAKNKDYNDEIVLDTNSYILGDINLGNGRNKISSLHNLNLGTAIVNSAIIGNITGGINDNIYSNFYQDNIRLKNTDIKGDIDLKNSSNLLDLSYFSSLDGNYTGGKDDDTLKFSNWTSVNKNKSNSTINLNNGTNSLEITNYSNVFANYEGGVNSDFIVLDNHSSFEGSISLGYAQPDEKNIVYLDKNSIIRGNIQAGSGKDLVAVQSSAIIGDVNLNDGENQVVLSGSELEDSQIYIPLGLNTEKYTKPFGFLTYDDVKYGSLLKGNLTTGSGNDSLIVSVGEVQGDVNLGAGNNKIILQGGNATGQNLKTREFISKFFTSKITGAITTGEGNDSLAIEDAEIGGDINLGNGSNSITLSKNSVTKGNITTGSGDDTINIYTKSQNKIISTGAGDDIVRVVGTPESIKESVLTSVDGGDGYDIFDVSKSGHVSLKAENAISNIESIYISGNSSLVLNGPADIKLATSEDKAESGTDVTIDSGSSLVINHNEASADYNLGYNLMGDGLLKLDLNNHKLNISGGDQSEFAGSVELSRGQLEHNEKVKELLTQASLSLKEGGVLNAAHAVQASKQDRVARSADEEPSVIKSLTLDGGALHLAKHTPVGQNPNNSLKVKDLIVKPKDGNEFGKGFIVVDSFNKYDNSIANRKEQQGLLSQDEGEFVANLVEASGKVEGNGLKLEIRKDMNNSSDAVHKTDIVQGDEVVARANFGYKARIDDGTDNKKPKGINAVYGLKEIELLDGKQLDLVVDGDGAGTKSDLSAKLTGKGGISINKEGTDTTVLSLSNPNNDFTGSTTVLKGTLLAKGSNVLGSEQSHTKTLKLAENTKLKLADKAKIFVGNIDQAASSKLDIGNGMLNIAHDGETKESTIKANSLISSADAGVVLYAGQTTFEGPQDAYKGTTTIRNKAHASIADVKALGTGAVDIHEKGNLNLNFAEAATFANQVKGNGTITKFGKGALTLNPSERSSAFEGVINLSDGSLISGTAASPLALNAKEINVLQGKTLQAVGSLKGSLNNAGIVQIGDNNTPGDTYTVGSYDGAEGSELQLSAEWKNSGEFKSDKLVVKGIATGKTLVKAGADNIIKGDVKQGSVDKFSSDVITVGAEHGDPVFFGEAETDGAFKADLVKEGNNYRWKIGAKLNPVTPTFIAGKLASINNAFDSVGTLSERVSAQRHSMNYGGNIFGRISHGNAKFTSLRGDEYKFKNSQIQLGVGLLTSHGKDHSKTEVGLLASYGKNDVDVYDGETGSNSLMKFKGIGKNIAKTFSKKKAKAKESEVATVDTKSKAKKVGSIDSNVISLGLYTTGYLANGAYYDFVAQVNKVDNKYKTSDNYKSSQKGLVGLLSAEVGHSFPLGDSSWSATPQLQLVGQYMKLDGFQHSIRKVEASKDFSLRGRVGLSIAHKNDFYISANVLGDLKKPEGIKVGKDTVKESFNKYWGEVGVGGQLSLSKSSAIYADAKFTKNFSGENRSGYKGNVGLKYSW
ncbi:autotransporter outer membrane beta-barrel domain-containing protein [Taylorella equigenitalis]|uniref:autotransporter outer membrane beta-barrel domain-containing protein n=1 Tax=Taylorella equigenitalis TaxID=29575 RepID=UPI0023B1F243|nr:autotransporter outer membrane beta-barrel domain-containing protein [Taylorella equigenitalis]WEE00571.1 autotransporter outer membrane beta-barrel domain-containing protein [Taylorella equigenitalis]WEE02048.1 autotransporter outer membrane beta-barrel domain-containing protein [Taylorella equigenitalis]WFD78584.1 autotransporter outer membrane beta-barrel domain-containing protein [Taylorella equigenitalis]WFD80062.1 autotransporter outer membrane beta-barrel domain-containing protein [Ta